jgi:hypothetical protein
LDFENQSEETNCHLEIELLDHKRKKWQKEKKRTHGEPQEHIRNVLTH